MTKRILLPASLFTVLAACSSGSGGSGGSAPPPAVAAPAPAPAPGQPPSTTQDQQPPGKVPDPAAPVTPAPAPAPVKPTRAPAPAPPPVKPAPVKPTPAPAPSGQACAERLILVAAKKNVAANYGNRPESGGYCATGVRSSLQLSKVGNVTSGLGNAVDYLHTLPPHGFQDSGARDPRKAPPGSVLVFSGPDTASYQQTGQYGSPAGDWLGHVTIKGDDGRYYTDGRTAEPAIGWTNGVNVQHRRNVAGMFVPTAALSAKYDGKCANITADEQVADLVLDTAELGALPFEDPASREAGQRLVQEALAVLARGNSAAIFAQALPLAREGTGFDEEGQLAQALAGRLLADPSLMATLDQFVSSLPTEHGLEACKTKVLVNDLTRDLCLKKAGNQGQEGADATCVKPISWESCLATQP